MRENLKKIDGLRKEFIGTFVRYGTKTNFKGYPEKTILLSNVHLSNYKDIFTEHIWFNLTKEFSKIDLKDGDIVSFQARVKEYYKGYKGYREEIQFEKPIERDYKLSHPTKIKIIQKI